LFLIIFATKAISHSSDTLKNAIAIKIIKTIIAKAIHTTLLQDFDSELYIPIAAATHIASKKS
jgi:hypothetical protein